MRPLPDEDFLFLEEPLLDKPKARTKLEDETLEIAERIKLFVESKKPTAPKEIVSLIQEARTRIISLNFEKTNKRRKQKRIKKRRPPEGQAA